LRNVETTWDRAPSLEVVPSGLYARFVETMAELREDCVALMVTPPYHVGKECDSDLSFDDYLALLRADFKEAYRVLEPGGRAVVNVANLERRPYVSSPDHVTAIVEPLKFLPRGQVIGLKARGACGSCAWGSWRSASDPNFRDLHEYWLCFSKERWSRARKGVSTISRDEFPAASLSVWEIPSGSARRVPHPAPFPVALPRRFIDLYTYLDDLVLDPFLGSVSTAAAAAETGRRYVGYDINEGYLGPARRRVLAARPYAPSLDGWPTS
jgi:site-specific DNA-methyltransferase (adenine-specific)